MERRLPSTQLKHSDSVPAARAGKGVERASRGVGGPEQEIAEANRTLLRTTQCVCADASAGSKHRRPEIHHTGQPSLVPWWVSPNSAIFLFSKKKVLADQSSKTGDSQ